MHCTATERDTDGTFSASGPGLIDISLGIPPDRENPAARPGGKLYIIRVACPHPRSPPPHEARWSEEWSTYKQQGGEYDSERTATGAIIVHKFPDQLRGSLERPVRRRVPHHDLEPLSPRLCLSRLPAVTPAATAATLKGPRSMRLTLTLATALAVASPATAQELPVQIGGNLTSAQRAAAVATLKQIRAILLQVPELREPNGFEIHMDGYGGSKKLGPDQKPVPGGTSEYMLRVFFFYPVRRGNEGCTCIDIRVNSESIVPGSRGIPDAEGREVMVEGARGAPVAYAVQTWDGLSEDRMVKSSVKVALVTRGDLPWKHTTREEYYAASILEREGPGGAQVKEFQKSLEKTPYQQWMEGAEERRKNREQSIAAAARQSAEYAAQVRKRLEENETRGHRSLQEVGRLGPGEQQARPGAAGHPVLERPRRARGDDARGTGPAGLRHGGVSGLGALRHRIQRPGRGRPRGLESQAGPHDELRFLARAPVTGGGAQHHGAHFRRTDGQQPPVHHALLQTFKKLDWAALNRLLVEPR